MKTATSRTSRTISRAQQIWAEVDYAQRRMFELRTGVPVVPRQNRREATRLYRG